MSTAQFLTFLEFLYHMCLNSSTTVSSLRRVQGKLPDCLGTAVLRTVEDAVAIPPETTEVTIAIATKTIFQVKTCPK